MRGSASCATTLIKPKKKNPHFHTKRGEWDVPSWVHRRHFPVPVVLAPYLALLLPVSTPRAVAGAMMVVTVLLLVVVAQAAAVGSATLVMVAVVLSLIVGVVVVVPSFVSCFLLSRVGCRGAESVVTRCLEFKISWLVVKSRKKLPGAQMSLFEPRSRLSLFLPSHVIPFSERCVFHLLGPFRGYIQATKNKIHQLHN